MSKATFQLRAGRNPDDPFDNPDDPFGEPECLFLRPGEYIAQGDPEQYTCVEMEIIRFEWLLRVDRFWLSVESKYDIEVACSSGEWPNAEAPGIIQGAYRRLNDREACLWFLRNLRDLPNELQHVADSFSLTKRLEAQDRRPPAGALVTTRAHAPAAAPQGQEDRQREFQEVSAQALLASLRLQRLADPHGADGPPPAPDEWDNPTRPVPPHPVELTDDASVFLVRSKEKTVTADGLARTIRILIEYYPKLLTGPLLKDKTNLADPATELRKLAKDDPDWERVLVMASDSWGTKNLGQKGYGLRP